jgi:hypothetical protein
MKILQAVLELFHECGQRDEVSELNALHGFANSPNKEFILQNVYAIQSVAPSTG